MILQMKDTVSSKVKRIRKFGNGSHELETDPETDDPTITRFQANLTSFYVFLGFWYLVRFLACS